MEFPDPSEKHGQFIACWLVEEVSVVIQACESPRNALGRWHSLIIQRRLVLLLRPSWDCCCPHQHQITKTLTLPVPLPKFVCPQGQPAEGRHLRSGASCHTVIQVPSLGPWMMGCCLISNSWKTRDPMNPMLPAGEVTSMPLQPSMVSF